MKKALLAVIFFAVSGMAVAGTTTALTVTEVTFIDGIGVGASTSYTVNHSTPALCETSKALVLGEEYPDMTYSGGIKHIRVARVANCLPVN